MAADGRVGFAPIVKRLSHLGEHRVAMVAHPDLPASDVRADPGRQGDSWYADWTNHYAGSAGRA